ncbi:hypothetical protein L1887_55975 [Cichorium endivia]|nr:hypothetical protein L1887_55975 [Cichorium endivia]
MRRGGKWDRTVQACVAHSSPIEVATVRKFDRAASERVFVAARRARSDVEPARYRRQHLKVTLASRALQSLRSSALLDGLHVFSLCRRASVSSTARETLGWRLWVGGPGVRAELAARTERACPPTTFWKLGPLSLGGRGGGEVAASSPLDFPASVKSARAQRAIFAPQSDPRSHT